MLLNHQQINAMNEIDRAKFRLEQAEERYAQLKAEYEALLANAAKHLQEHLGAAFPDGPVGNE